jgi:hypothetical protein
MDYPGKVITKTQVTPTQTSASGNWTLDDQAAAIKNNNWPVALVPNPISKSLRFNSADSAYLNRTPASAGNRRTWTWSGWVKRSALVAGTIFGAGATNGNNFVMYFESDDTLVMLNWTSFVDNFRLKTTQVFRDVSAWYHIVAVLDTTQATSSNRVKLYLNGTQITVLTTATYPTQNFDSTVNTAAVHTLGARSFDAPSLGFNGYMTEVNFIDGQALTPSSFGMTNPQTGQWIPLKYSGTYGTNGFYLNFKDATSTTTLGYDYSGNANNWTTNNFSVTAGAGNDSLTDVPTPWFAYNTTGDVGGVFRGNYCTLNPLRMGASSSLANGNLDFTSTSSAGSIKQAQITGTFGIPASGKWYFECTPTTIGASIYIGVISDTHSMDSTPFSGTPIRTYRSSTGDKSDGGTDSAYGNTYTTNDVIGVAVNMDAGEIKFYKNGTVQNSGTAAFTNLAGTTWVPYCVAGSSNTTNNGNFNFGQRPFAYTPPTGFRSLCTTNLPATAIGFGLTNQGNNYFDATLYTGNGTSQSITNSGAMQPDFVWVKSRSLAGSYNILEDVIRGTSKYLITSLTNAEGTSSQLITAFNSNGFSVGNDNSANQNAQTYVGWQWKGGGTGVSNTAGSITSTVSANTTAGFSIVTYGGSGASGTVGHGLGVAPSMIIVKNRSAAENWMVYRSDFSAPASDYMQLNTTGAKSTFSNIWGGTATSSVFYLGGNYATINSSGNNYVAYCFAAVPGYSAFGSYTGNGSTDGPFVFTNFRPRFVMWKNTTTNGYNWEIIDTARDTYNVMLNVLGPNSSAAESAFAGPPYLDALSNGFKVRTGSASSGYQNINNNGDTYIYAAFAEFPFQFANAR